MATFDENSDYVPATLRASIRGGMKPGYMCSTNASRQSSRTSKNPPANIPPPKIRRPFSDVSNQVNKIQTPRQPSMYKKPVTPRVAAPRKKDASTNTDEYAWDDLDALIDVLQQLNHLNCSGGDSSCVICTGNGEEGWRALVPCGHEFCEGCAVWEVEDRCPTCRSSFVSTLKVYRS